MSVTSSTSVFVSGKKAKISFVNEYNEFVYFFGSKVLVSEHPLCGNYGVETMPLGIDYVGGSYEGVKFLRHYGDGKSVRVKKIKRNESERCILLLISGLMKAQKESQKQKEKIKEQEETIQRDKMFIEETLAHIEGYKDINHIE